MIDSDFSTPPVFPKTHPYGRYSGYVQNWTLSQDICYHPHLRNTHGTFVEPVSISTPVSLVPMFSGSKLLANNDILLQSPCIGLTKNVLLQASTTSLGRTSVMRFSSVGQHQAAATGAKIGPGFRNTVSYPCSTEHRCQ